MQTTHAVDSLPAIPTQDWVNACAGAVAQVHHHAVAISIVATINTSSDSITVISSGVGFRTQEHQAEQNLQDRHDPRSIALQDKTERISRLGCSLPEHALEDGLVASFAAIDPNWNTTPIGRAISGAHLSHPLLQLIPINQSKARLTLLNLIAFESGAGQHEAQIALHTLSSLHRILSTRARDALANVVDPRAWLTDREQSVLAELIEGHSVRAIAEKLGRSAHTVHDHVKNLHKKIGASSRGELIALALGHKHNRDPKLIHDPITRNFAGDQVAELKSPNIMARPLRP